MSNVLPEGLIWPQFEDGTPVNIGDYVLDECDKEVEAKVIHFSHDGCWRISDLVSSTALFRNGEKCKRPFTDSWEKLEEDTRKAVYEYWGCNDISCNKCVVKNGAPPYEIYGCGGCGEAMKKDLVARAKKMAEHERGR